MQAQSHTHSVVVSHIHSDPYPCTHAHASWLMCSTHPHTKFTHLLTLSHAHTYSHILTHTHYSSNTQIYTHILIYTLVNIYSPTHTYTPWTNSHTQTLIAQNIHAYIRLYWKFREKRQRRSHNTFKLNVTSLFLPSLPSAYCSFHFSVPCFYSLFSLQIFKNKSKFLSFSHAKWLKLSCIHLTILEHLLSSTFTVYPPALYYFLEVVREGSK
jgi:hypothetical protein